MTLVQVRAEHPQAMPSVQFGGDLVPLTRQLYDGNRTTARVYINRRNVLWISDDHKGNTYVHMVGEDTIQVTEALDFVAGALR